MKKVSILLAILACAAVSVVYFGSLGSQEARAYSEKSVEEVVSQINKGEVKITEEVDTGDYFTEVSWDDPATNGWLYDDDATRNTLGFTATGSVPAGGYVLGCHGILNGDSDNPCSAYTVFGAGTTFNVTGTVATSEKTVGWAMIFAIDAGSQIVDSSLALAVINYYSPFDLPPVCLSGTNTTNFANIADNRAVENFIMDCPGSFSVSFVGPYDFSASLGAEAITRALPLLSFIMNGSFIETNNGNSIVDIENPYVNGFLGNPTGSLEIFDLPYLSTPTIFVDGELENIFSNVTYNASTGKLDFDTEHFSTFTPAPVMTITSPTDAEEVEEETLTIEGNINDPNATITITLNEDDPVDDIEIDDDGDFSYELTLVAGENDIVITPSNNITEASGYDLDDLTQSFTITYTEPAPTPEPEPEPEVLPATGFSW